MGATWQQWSAASLASGAVLLVLGSLMAPADGLGVPALIASVEGDSGRWVMAAFAFLLASVTMTLGLPTVLTLIGTRGRRLAIAAVGVWAMGTIGLAAYAALLICFRTVVAADALTATEAARVSADPGLGLFLLSITTTFVLGEALTGIALIHARAVPLWVGLLLVAHAVTGALVELVPAVVERGQILMLGVALMGVAMQVSENGSRVRRSSTL